jgi:hypothetical protein
MNAEHEMHCTFVIHVKELFDGVHDKFHWSVPTQQRAGQAPQAEGVEGDVLRAKNFQQHSLLLRLLCVL